MNTRPVPILAALCALAHAGCAADDRSLGPDDQSADALIDPAASSFRIAVALAAGGEQVQLDGLAVQADAARREVTCRAALINASASPLYTPLELVVTALDPDSIRVLDADRYTPEGFPIIDFSDHAGGDGVLAPGEMSARRPLNFSVREGQPFMFGSTLVTGIGPRRAAIGGVVFIDRIANSRRDRGEPGIQGIAITLRKSSRTIADTVTDGDGRYVFVGLAPGPYSVQMEGADLATVTPNPRSVALVGAGGGQPRSFLAADFACFPRPEPGAEPVVLGPLRAPANGETTTGRFILAEPPVSPLLLTVEAVCGDDVKMADTEVLVNGHVVVSAADFSITSRRELKREILPDLLRAGGNTVEAHAAAGDSAGCLVITIRRHP